MAIVVYPAPDLRVHCRPAPNFEGGTKTGCAILANEAMRNRCYAVAAPQIGWDVAAFSWGVMPPGFKGNWPGGTWVNPKLLDASFETETSREGCLSFPNKYWDITRPKAVKVEWYDVNGNRWDAEFHGLAARVIFHEVDHLDGKLICDRLRDQLPTMVRQQRRVAERYLVSIGERDER